jgi:phosphohistidine phosphatase
MRTLYVLRHAKSSWGDPSLPDHERPLAPRGREACAALRRHCDEAGIRPQLVLCSTARRAGETLHELAPVLGDPDVLVEEGLYHASREDLLARLQLVEQDSALLVGHNPGLQDLVLLLAAPGALRDRVAEKLPTGALVTLEVETLGAGGATLVALVTPRGLRD